MVRDRPCVARSSSSARVVASNCTGERPVPPESTPTMRTAVSSAQYTVRPSERTKKSLATMPWREGVVPV